MKRTILVFVALLSGCSFNVSSTGSDLGAGGVDMATGGSGGSGDTPDLSSDPPDMTMICTPGATSCTGGMLTTCNADGTGTDTRACALGCNAGGSDCLQLYATAPAAPTDFAYAGLSAPVFAATQTLLMFDTATGEIKDGGGATVRMSNPSPTSRFVENGIGFHRTGGVGIWTFASLTVPITATVVFKGTYGASLVSVGDMTIAGTIDARGYGFPSVTLCQGNVAGPGGGAGSMSGTPAGGMGGGAAGGNDHAGGSGASYGGVGGKGGGDGSATPQGGGTPPAVYGTTSISPLTGGSGGGVGGGTGGAIGGGGGGAVQLAAQGSITISGAINAGGCGGGAGGSGRGAGGGGDGGAILVEAPIVHLTATAILAANGGAGGGGDGGMAGQPGQASGSSAGTGGVPGAQGGAGGNGSIAGTPAGANAGDAANNGGGGGGGGGGAGYIRLNTKPSMLAVDAGAVRSPRASDQLATSGSVDIH